jgi:hypothetical protein
MIIEEFTMENASTDLYPIFFKKDELSNLYSHQKLKKSRVLVVYGTTNTPKSFINSPDII